MTKKIKSPSKYVVGSFLGLLAVVAVSMSVAQPRREQKPPDPQQKSTGVVSEWIAIARGKIDIEGGLIRLAAGREGIIRQVLVEEGDRVKKNQILAMLDDSQSRLSLSVAENEERQAQAALTVWEIRLHAAKRESARVELLLQSSAVAVQEVDDKRDQVRLMGAELVSATSALAVAKSRRLVSQYEVSQRLIRAPLDGRIVKRQAKVGDGISTSNVTSLFQFAPDTAQIVRADLEERHLRLVKPNMEAEITLEADETQKFKGKVLRIGRVLGVRSGTDDSTEKADVRVVECVLSIEDQALLIGQRVLVRIRR
jgi:HlyD family secretion protein